MKIFILPKLIEKAQDTRILLFYKTQTLFKICARMFLKITEFGEFKKITEFARIELFGFSHSEFSHFEFSHLWHGKKGTQRLYKGTKKNKNTNNKETSSVIQ